MTRRAHDEGRLLAAWTTDTPRRMRRLVRYGVDATTTNRVAALRSALRRR